MCITGLQLTFIAFKLFLRKYKCYQRKTHSGTSSELTIKSRIRLAKDPDPQNCYRNIEDFRSKKKIFLHSAKNFSVFIQAFQLTKGKIIYSSLSFRRSKVSSCSEYRNQYCGSGSGCFWASLIRIRKYEVRIWIQLWLWISKNSKKNIDSYCCVTFLWLFIIGKWSKCTVKK